MLSLSDAVICYAGHCDQLDKLGGLVERVANKHVSFGVESEHYPVVGGVLLQTLEVGFCSIVYDYKPLYLPESSGNRSIQCRCEGCCCRRIFLPGRYFHCIRRRDEENQRENLWRLEGLEKDGFEEKGS